MPKQRNARSRVKKSMKNATVDLSVQSRSRKVKMNHPYQSLAIGVKENQMRRLTNKKNPKEFKNAALLPPPRAVTIPKPPGVRVIPTEIQKPPNEDNAVAPKVFPTAISLKSRVKASSFVTIFVIYIPHASK